MNSINSLPTSTESKFNVERVFAEIVAGRTPVCLAGRSAFFRHLTPARRGESSYHYDEVIKQCERKNIPTLQSRLEALKKSGAWTEEQENGHLNATEYVGRLQDILKTLIWPSQIEDKKKEIDAAKKVAAEKAAERNAVVGVTAEQFADKKANEKFIFDNLCRDSECAQGLFASEEYEELEDTEIENIVLVINGIIRDYQDSYVKKAGLSQLVRDLISISEGDAMRFYGVPAIKLTYYQIELLNYGRWFKEMLSDPKKKPPAHMLDNPDQLIEWSTGQSNAANILNTPGSNVAIFDGSTEDIKAVTGEEARSLNQIVQKSGKARGAAAAKIFGLEKK